MEAPQSITAVYAISVNQYGLYAVIGNGNTAEFRGTPPSSIRLVHLVGNRIAPPVVAFEEPIDLGPNGQLPSLAGYAQGLALVYTDGNRLTSVQYVSFEGTLSAPVALGGGFMPTSGFAISNDGSLFSTRTSSMPECGSSVLLPATDAIRKYDKTGHALDYKLPFTCSSVYSIEPLPDGDVVAVILNDGEKDLKDALLIRLKSSGGIAWQTALNAGFMSIDDHGNIFVENFAESHNQDQIDSVDPRSGAVKLLHAWPAKTATDFNRIVNLFVGPDRVYARVETLRQDNKSFNFVLYSFSVAGLGSSYQA